jgi:hypothetical protein
MKAFLFSTYFSILISFALFAQSDSLAVVNAEWKKEKISQGVVLKTFWFQNTLFNSNQFVSVLEIKQKKRLEFDIGYDPKKLIITSDFGTQANAIAALNGTFFDMANGGSVDFIKSDMKVINENRLGKNGNRAGHQRSALVINKGKITIAKWDGTANWEKSLAGEDIMVSGPLLILDQIHERRFLPEYRCGFLYRDVWLCNLWDDPQILGNKVVLFLILCLCCFWGYSVHYFP